MRFMNLIKSTENAGSPPKALLDAIARFGQEAMGTGWLVSAGGLFPSAMGARVRLAAGKLTISDGPFTESKELIGAYAIYKVESKQEAVERASQFLQLYKEHWPVSEGEVEVRQMFDSPPEGESG
jgi:hypothetical protein